MDLWSHQERVLKSDAGVSQAPVRAGPERDYGGEWYVTIGGLALCTGRDGEYLAAEIAKRWNHVANVCDHSFVNAHLLAEGGRRAICEKCGLVATLPV